MPEISVIIPSYNHAAYIGEAVKSVLLQSFSDFELIVVDDGSTDQSLEVLSGFSDHRLRVMTQSNMGAHNAINRGLYSAKGEYLAILNSDDLYHPFRLERMLQVLKADRQIGLVGSHIELIDSVGKSIGIKHGYADCPPWPLEAPDHSFRAGGDLHKALLTENYWSTTSNFVFSRRLFDLVGEFCPLQYTHDWDFALRTAKMSNIVLLPEALMQYRIHASNTIRNNQVAMIFEICWCLAVHLPQHLADPTFLDPSDAIVVDELLHSIYTFGMERVLNVMLLQRLSENQQLALDLLFPGNLIRENYLAFIQKELGREKSISTAVLPVIQANLFERVLSKLRSNRL